uniref:Uncharacterized protein n=1 Tax=viral metagenome TaxID=1070528 RepID=A0A6C0F0P6_9ZZZZ
MIFHSLRTSIIFVSGLIIYEILLDLEKVWNRENPGHEILNFSKRNIIKFISIFLLDFILLYLFYWLFDTML